MTKTQPSLDEPAAHDWPAGETLMIKEIINLAGGFDIKSWGPDGKGPPEPWKRRTSALIGATGRGEINFEPHLEMRLRRLYIVDVWGWVRPRPGDWGWLRDFCKQWSTICGVELDVGGAAGLNKREHTNRSGAYSPARLRKWYLERIEEYTKEGKIPTRDEDCAAAKNDVSINVPRDAVRALRNELAPEEWRTRGVRKSQ